MPAETDAEGIPFPAPGLSGQQAAPMQPPSPVGTPLPQPPADPLRNATPAQRTKFAVTTRALGQKLMEARAKAASAAREAQRLERLYGPDVAALSETDKGKVIAAQQAAQAAALAVQQAQNAREAGTAQAIAELQAEQEEAQGQSEIADYLSAATTPEELADREQEALEKFPEHRTFIESTARSKQQQFTAEEKAAKAKAAKAFKSTMAAALTSIVKAKTMDDAHAQTLQAMEAADAAGVSDTATSNRLLTALARRGAQEAKDLATKVKTRDTAQKMHQWVKDQIEKARARPSLLRKRTNEIIDEREKQRASAIRLKASKAAEETGEDVNVAVPPKMTWAEAREQAEEEIGPLRPDPFPAGVVGDEANAYLKAQQEGITRERVDALREFVRTASSDRYDAARVERARRVLRKIGMPL
jgi:hypothetical protein